METEARFILLVLTYKNKQLVGKKDLTRRNSPTKIQKEYYFVIKIKLQNITNTNIFTESYIQLLINN